MRDTDIVDWLRNFCTDWNGAQMVRGEPPRDGLHCGDIMDAAAEIERLRAALQTIVDRAANDPDARAYEMAGIARASLEQLHKGK